MLFMQSAKHKAKSAKIITIYYLHGDWFRFEVLWQ